MIDDGERVDRSVAPATIDRASLFGPAVVIQPQRR